MYYTISTGALATFIWYRTLIRNGGMIIIFILGIVLTIFGVHLFLKDTYMLQGFILMILGEGILCISLSYMV